MPELPEVETIRGQLEAAVLGSVVLAGWGHASPKFSAAPLAVGRRVTAVARRGKYLLLALDGELELVVHLGMTGALEVRPWSCDTTAHSGAAQHTTAHTRAWWRLDGDRVLLFHDVRRFGRLAVVPAGDHRALPTLAALGPEPFGEAFTPAGLHRALSVSRARLKTQILSQRPVAGVGNIYADEAFWAARVNPGARTITRPQAARLHAAIRAALQRGLDHGGTTLRDYRGVDGERGSGQLHLDCYGRAGAPCRRCATPLRRQVFDGRSTTTCPACQRR